MPLSKKVKDWWIGGLDIPLTISGLQLWLDDPAIASNIIEDGGNRVSQWTDLSGVGNHMTQATGANQPTLVGGIEINFDGSTESLDNLSPSGILTNTSGTTVMVTKYDGSSNAGFIWGDSGGLGHGGLRSIGGGTQMRMLQSPNDIRSTPVHTNDTYFIYILSSSGTAYRMRLNDTIKGFDIITGDDDGLWVGDATFTNISIGGILRSAPFFGAIKGIKSVLYYDNQLSSDQEDELVNFLNTKFSVF